MRLRRRAAKALTTSVLALGVGSAGAQVGIDEVEQFYLDPSVFTPAQPPGQAHATRFPSLSANGHRLAFARAGQAQIVLRAQVGGALEVVAAPGVLDSGRDYSLSLDGQVLAFAASATAGKGNCGREIVLRNALTGTQVAFPGASCLSRPSKPVVPQFGLPFAYASNITLDGVPSPSSSYDLYFRPGQGLFGKGTAAASCLTCAQDPGGDGRLSVNTFSNEPVSAIAYRDNRNLWFSPDGRRLAFSFSVAYQRCAGGDPDCGESGLVVADVIDDTVQVRRTLRVSQRNRFLDVHGSAAGDRLVFSTRSALSPDDDDDTLDVYAYDVAADRLRLLSRALTGSVNDPRISGNGRYLTFWSDSRPRILPPPLDVQPIGCGFVFQPVSTTSRLHLLDLQGAEPRMATVVEETREFTNECFSAIEPLREATDINHSGTLIAVATRKALASGDSNGREDVYLVSNHFARDAIFDHGFD